MPIGLPDDGVREADECARKELGPRRSTVFITPVRRAFEGATHAEANEINREITGKGISAQAFALKGKVLEVDEWVRRSRSRRIVEVHPELSFAELGDGPLDTTKASWAYMEKRRGLLAGAGIVLEGTSAQPGGRRGSMTFSMPRPPPGRLGGWRWGGALPSGGAVRLQ